MANLTVEFDDDELEYLAERVREGGDIRNIVTNYLRFGTEIYGTFCNKVIEEVQAELAKERTYTVTLRGYKVLQVKIAYDNNDDFNKRLTEKIDNGDCKIIEDSYEIADIEEN